MADRREQAKSATRDGTTEAEKQLVGDLWVPVTCGQMSFSYFRVNKFIYFRNPDQLVGMI